MPPSSESDSGSSLASRVFSRPSFLACWLPMAIAIAAILLAILAFGDGIIANLLGVVFIAGLAWFLGLAIYRFAKKRIAAGFGALVCLGLSFLAMVLAVAVALFKGFIAEDDFARDLALPEGVELAEPASYLPFEDEAGDAGDTFQHALRKSLENSGSDDPSLTIDLGSLATVQKSHPDLLRRFLAAHPGWRVFEEKGGEFATRRWMVKSRWQWSLHGYYSSFHGPDGPRYQSRTTIGLTGKPWAGGPQFIESGKVATPELGEGNGMFESHVAVRVGDLVVEQFEQSEAKERRITKSAFSALEREFAALAADPTWENARSLLPEDAVIGGKPFLALANSFQGGVYNALIRCNPGEPGRIYLRAYEITQDERLSEGRLHQRTNEWVGWSDDPEEQFLSETHFTIYEGEWGQYYGARFEVWFEPDNAGAERKLLEGNFKIEGWTR